MAHPNKLVRNELRKLRAAWYNNASIAVLVAGFLSPFWTIVYGTAATSADEFSRTVGFIVCVAAGVFLRFAGRLALGGLEE
ncbi:MAG: hypothetical protein HZA66_09210 [Rhodopseudomonas palustris]|uniref:Uncharacterized protein n=1 Tax=Rhodopseudomonas palustris TaxID=1076 RepID=A0A933VV94_RHOPL|nr:hypothetical protein [Rhodopseudomonas palustris]